MRNRRGIAAVDISPLRMKEAADLSAAVAVRIMTSICRVGDGRSVEERKSVI